MTDSTEVEKAFDKTQHLFMIKTLINVVREKYISHNKGHYD